MARRDEYLGPPGIVLGLKFAKSGRTERLTSSPIRENFVKSHVFTSHCPMNIHVRSSSEDEPGNSRGSVHAGTKARALLSADSPFCRQHDREDHLEEVSLGEVVASPERTLLCVLEKSISQARKAIWRRVGGTQGCPGIGGTRAWFGIATDPERVEHFHSQSCRVRYIPDSAWLKARFRQETARLVHEWPTFITALRMCTHATEYRGSPSIPAP